MLLEAWSGRLLSSATAGLPALRLDLQEELVRVIVQMTTGPLIGRLVGDIVWKVPFLDMWLFPHGKQFLVSSEIYHIYTSNIQIFTNHL